MVTGKRAFPQQSPAQILAAILRDQPAGCSIVKSPSSRATLLDYRTVSGKNPKDRYDSTHDFG